MDRFTSKFKEVPSGCWEWQTSCFQRRGYGQFKVGKKNWLAHRFAFTLFVGSIPDGLLVCHRCDNVKCVNPSHLFLGTAKDNNHDMIAKGRYRQGMGASKLTPAQVVEIRQRRAAAGKKLPHRVLAKEYGVSAAAIGLLLRNHTWREKFMTKALRSSQHDVKLSSS